MHLRWATFHISCQSTKPVQKQPISIIATDFFLIHIKKTPNFSFLPPATETICGSRGGNPRLKAAPDLKSLASGNQRKAFGKNVTQLPKTISIPTRRWGSCPSVGPSKRPPDYTCHDYGDVAAVSAQTPIKYEWLSSRRGSPRLWKEFGRGTLFRV